MIELHGRPLAYAQDYDPHAWPGHHFAHLPPGSRGIDQSIGDAELLDKGHGAAVGTDPHPDNGRAIRAYQKAGFTITGGPRDTPWGRAILMECWR